MPIPVPERPHVSGHCCLEPAAPTEWHDAIPVPKGCLCRVTDESDSKPTRMDYQMHRTAISLVAYCLNSATAFSIASASVAASTLANPCLPGGKLVDTPAKGLGR